MKKKQIKENLVHPEHAARHAAAHLHIGVFTNTPGMTTWRGANLGELTTIYDLNGLPLFHDFPVLSPLLHEQVGTIRASASRVLGVPVPTTYIGGSRWNTSAATLWSHKFVEGELKGRIIDSKPVCYAYPKLGIEVKWKKGPKGRIQRTIIDVGDHSVVPKKVTPKMRGLGALPVYDNIPEKLVGESIEKFSLYDKLVDELQKRAGLDLANFLELEEFHRVQTSLIEMIPWYTSKILTFCTHGYSHECFRLHGQEKGNNCAAATGQMILDFWRYHYSQDEIGTAMGYTGSPIGVPSEITGLESLTCDHFDAQSDKSPTFDKVKNEIGANRPFDYYYWLHSTACAGYSQVNFHVFGTIPEQSVYLYDPWPVNTGAIRWETFDTISTLWYKLDGFVYLKRPQPTP